MFCFKLKKSKAFTLIELIIVIAIVALLAAASFVAINPSRRMGQAADAQRWEDLLSIAKAVEMYTADHGQLPTDLNIPNVGIGDKIVLCSSASSLTCDGQSNNCLVVNDADFIGDYLPRLPIDPNKSAIIDTGYYITRTEGNLISFGACDSYQTTRDLEVKSIVPLPDYVDCDGYYALGYCWYQNPTIYLQSCNTVCATHGGCVAENWNDDSNCSVLRHFQSCDGLGGCAVYAGSAAPIGGDMYGGWCLYRNSGTSQDCAATDGGARLCACAN